MTIGAEHGTLIQLFPYFLPATSIAFVGNSEIFVLGIEMVKFQGF
jgi:hypothetical protein